MSIDIFAEYFSQLERAKAYTELTDGQVVKKIAQQVFARLYPAVTGKVPCAPGVPIILGIPHQ